MLPEGSEWISLVNEYPGLTNDEMDFKAKEYGYKNTHSFRRAMQNRGVLRRNACSPECTTCDNPCSHETLSQSNFVDYNVSPTKENTINHPLSIKTDGRPVKIAIISDTHNPYQDKKAVRLVEDFLKEQQPDYLIFNGDIADFYQISTFDKDPQRASKLQEDIDNARDMIWDFRIALPDTKFYFIEGNHEFRLQRYLWANAPALASLRSLALEELLTLKDYKCTLIPYEQGLMVNDIFLILHGDISSIHSGWTAKRLYEKHGGCGVAGHCHKLGNHLKRNRFGIYGWWEGGCLCDLEPDYCQHPNWTQGFTLVTFIGHRFFTESVPIIDGKFIFGSNLYE